MPSNAPPFKIVKDESQADLRNDYDAVARGALRVLWRRKWMLAGFLLFGLVGGSTVVVEIGPRYSSEAFVEPNLVREVAGSGNNQGSVVIDAAVLVDGAAKIIRSRLIADAVVERLGLEKAPAFTRQSLLSHLRSEAQKALLPEPAAPSPYELAVKTVMHQVRVTTDPHSYLISIAATADSPEAAATLANTFALEYLRSQTLQELSRARQAAEQEVTQLSLTYGVHHPNYVRAWTKLEQLQAQITDLRTAATEKVQELAGGYSVVPAEKALIPSGPNIPLVLMLAAGAALSVGVSLAKLWGGATTHVS
jgi:uncharacterized protein involved in exopolysaccharide biosynthesis